MTLEHLNLQDFSDTHDLENLIEEPTCLKEINRTCINLIMTHHYEV